MNENDDLERLRRMLPPPAEPVLSADRRRLLREHLMNEITPDPSVSAAPRPRRRLGWVALPVVAGGLALALVLANGGGVTNGGPAKAAPAAPATAAELLDRVAEVAATKPVLAVRDDQFAYVKTLLQDSTMTMNGKQVTAQLNPMRQTESWTSADGSKPGLVIDPNDRLSPRSTTEPIKDPSLDAPTYSYLATLPTDPDVLLKQIYQHEANDHAYGPDMNVFSEIGRLLRGQIAPPALYTALYRAAAQIPGVTLVSDSTDAEGRHGVAVAEEYQGVQWQWIFDPSSYEFLGERYVVVKDGVYGKAGDLLGQSAVLQRAAVDRAGDQPQ